MTRAKSLAHVALAYVVAIAVGALWLYAGPDSGRLWLDSLVADVLATHPKVSRLIYPGRADHPQADIIKKQMSGGSTMIGFEVKGGKAGAFRALNGFEVARISNNLGDAKSIVTHPATTTHQRLTPDERAELGIGDGFIRFSVGLEHVDDLIEDVQGALAKV